MKILEANRGIKFLVSDIDFERVSQYSWSLNTLGYLTNHKIGLLHQYILINSNPNFIIDHINQNKLDNTRENLREVTRSENALNSKTQLRSSRNIYRTPTHNYEVKITRNNQCTFVGTYSTFEMAQQARDEYLSNLQNPKPTSPVTSPSTQPPSSNDRSLPRRPDSWSRYVHPRYHAPRKA